MPQNILVASSSRASLFTSSGKTHLLSFSYCQIAQQKGLSISLGTSIQEALFPQTHGHTVSVLLLRPCPADPNTVFHPFTPSLVTLRASVSPRVCESQPLKQSQNTEDLDLAWLLGAVWPQRAVFCAQASVATSLTCRLLAWVKCRVIWG